jgi:hypothetical protein
VTGRHEARDLTADIEDVGAVHALDTARQLVAQHKAWLAGERFMTSGEAAEWMGRAAFALEELSR